MISLINPLALGITIPNLTSQKLETRVQYGMLQKFRGVNWLNQTYLDLVIMISSKIQLRLDN